MEGKLKMFKNRKNQNNFNNIEKKSYFKRTKRYSKTNSEYIIRFRQS